MTQARVRFAESWQLWEALGVGLVRGCCCSSLATQPGSEGLQVCGSREAEPTSQRRWSREKP